MTNILAAVGDLAARSHVEPEALNRGLSLCAEWYREACLYSTNIGGKEKTSRLALVSKSTRRLLQLLRKDDEARTYDWSSLIRRLRVDGQDPIAALENLLSLAEADLIQETGQPKIKTVENPTHYLESLRALSPIEFLVGSWLPMLYATFFKIQEPLSPFDSHLIPFIEASLKELNIDRNGRPYARNTIKKALAVVLDHRPARRKGGGNAVDAYEFFRRRLLLRVLFPKEAPPDKIYMISLSEHLQMEHRRKKRVGRKIGA